MADDDRERGGEHLSLLRVVLRAPQPLKTLYLLFFLAVVAAIVQLSGTGRTSLVMLLVGVLGATTGLVMATDFRGGATALSRLIKDARPWGVDHSRSFLSSPAYARLVGGGGVVVGVVFVVVALTTG